MYFLQTTYVVFIGIIIALFKAFGDANFSGNEILPVLALLLVSYGVCSYSSLDLFIIIPLQVTHHCIRGAVLCQLLSRICHVDSRLYCLLHHWWGELMYAA